MFLYVRAARRSLVYRIAKSEDNFEMWIYGFFPPKDKQFAYFLGERILSITCKISHTRSKYEAQCVCGPNSNVE